MIQRSVLFSSLVLVVGSSVQAQALTQFRNGAVADADAVNQNFTTVDERARAAAGAAAGAQRTADAAARAAGAAAQTADALALNLTMLSGDLAPIVGAISVDQRALSVFSPNDGAGWFGVFPRAATSSSGTQLVTWIGAPDGGAQQRFSHNGSMAHSDIGHDKDENFVVEHDDAVRFIVERGGDVGVGTTSPRTRLHVSRSDQTGEKTPAAVFETHNCGSTCGQPSPTEQIRLWNENPSGAQAGIGLAGGGSGALSNLPNVYVGTGSGSEYLDFNVYCRTSSTRLTRFFAVENDGICRNNSGAWSRFSDARLKEDIDPIDSDVALRQLLALQGVTFSYTQEAQDERGVPAGVQRGFIAQDVEKVLPSWVTTDEAGYRTVTERGVTALTVEAIRALRDENAELRARLETLEAAVHALQSR